MCFSPVDTDCYQITFFELSSDSIDQKIKAKIMDVKHVLRERVGRFCGAASKSGGFVEQGENQKVF
ncbi:hypothetical protein CHX27_02965 [Flavobacterium aurantiibacter]|uniref:Uncharacterized protein n=1 Tax=Flavobacterium aurantiibacter TaxID=2023067 RepID=A0A256A198_9FLAO|nr:hypothetical protein CHX27_02965 [Flavobacterium aurantiibacter]